ncbi:MAG: hypothetical protein KGL95_16040 [Patescibacteria group bacterium]|nr:hypothetical protein [Patescibacteria group bacterium]
MKSTKKSVYIAAILVVAIVGAFGASHAIQTEKPQVTEIDYALSIPTGDIVMKANETRVVPIGVYYPQEKALNATAGVTVPRNEAMFIATGDAKLPSGISAVLDQKEVNLPATASTGSVIRDTLNLKISVSHDTQPGKYRLAVLMFEENGQGSSRYINLEVQK